MQGQSKPIHQMKAAQTQLILYGASQTKLVYMNTIPIFQILCSSQRFALRKVIWVILIPRQIYKHFSLFLSVHFECV